jgi:hypothetical protein
MQGESVVKKRNLCGETSAKILALLREGGNWVSPYANQSLFSFCIFLLGLNTNLISALCQHRQTQRGTTIYAALSRLTRQCMEGNYMSHENETFDAQAEVERIRSRRAEARRKLFRKSRLDRYQSELLAMRRAGASCADLAEWLRVSHRCKINRSSVDRYLKNFKNENKQMREN